jgi:hypothetical protein
MLAPAVYLLHSTTVSLLGFHSKEVLEPKASLVCVQIGGIIATNIYLDDDKPLYHRGNRVLLGINVMVIVLFLFCKAYYVTKNKIRDDKWNSMSPKVRTLPLPNYNSLSCVLPY